MPRQFVDIVISRDTFTTSATGGKVPVGAPIPGSPEAGWPCRLYRQAQITVKRDEARPGVATIDQVPVLSIQDIACPVKVNDLAALPGGINGKILRIRRYTRTLQCDLETGAE
jgi:hypothetical protein